MKARKSMEPWLRDEIRFYDHQIDGVRQMIRMRNFLLADDMGLGKAEPVSQEVLTPSGWRLMGELRVGDEVIGSTGLPTKVLQVHPQGEVAIVKVKFSDKTTVRCSVDHLWAVMTPTQKQRGSDGFIVSTRKLMSIPLRDGAGNSKYFIPMTGPVEFSPVELKLDPYMIGALLGDGSISQHAASIATDQEIVENFDLPVDCEAVYTGVTNGTYSTYRLNGLAKYLRDLDLMGRKSEDKFVPEQYKFGSAVSRVKLLQGLLDTDGTPVVSRGKISGTTIEYGTVSEQLAKDVDHIVRSLGGKTSVALKSPKYTYNGESRNGQTFYRMVLSLPGWIVPFTLERKLERWTPRTKYMPTRAIVSIEADGVEEAQCITVDAYDSLYVTKDFTVTHNSLQSITVACADIVRGWAEKIIIVAPVTLKGNWFDEFEKFTRIPSVILGQELDVNNPEILKPMSPKARERQLEEFADMNGPRVLIVNYEQVLKHVHDFNWIGFDIAIFDEAHYLKNPKAKRTQACHKIRARRYFMLTGTPMLNQVNELWGVLHLIDKAGFPKYWSYVNRYCVYGGYQDKQIIGVKNEKELIERLQSVMIRRLKGDVLDLPSVQKIHRKVDLLPEQRKLYDQVITDLEIEMAGASTPSEVENALTKALRLKQICGTTLPFIGKDVSAKLDLAVEDAIELMKNGHKIVVFTQFRDVQRVFQDRLEAHGQKNKAEDFDLWELNGDTPKWQRTEIVKEWGTDPKPGALVGMLQVASVGLNMTSARHALFLDKLWVPGLNQQAIDRLHRIGQSETQPVQVYEYLTRGTVETRVEQILTKKSKIFGQVVNDADFKKKLVAALAEKDNAV